MKGVAFVLGSLLAALAAAIVASQLSLAPARADFRSAVGHLAFESPQVAPIAVSPDGSRIFACNTANDSLSILDAATRRLVAQVAVGLQPVSVAVRPDGAVVYVSNHLSDSISVVDPGRGVVLATIQEVAGPGEPDAGVTRFNEPAQVVFSWNGAHAYVALSEMNQVVVIDAQRHAVIGRIDLNGSLRTPAGEPVFLEDPRALAILGGGRYLAVAAFESGNRTEMRYEPGVPGDVFPGTCNTESDRLALRDHITGIELGAGMNGDVVVNPAIPDRDLVLIDLETAEPVAILGDVGTLLYGVLAARRNQLLVVHTDARNHRNGSTALDGRPWLNRMSAVVFEPATRTWRVARTIDLDAPEAGVPSPEAPAAIPYGIAVSPDRSVAYVTAAGSDRLLFVSSAGDVLRRVPAGAHPTGVAVNAARGEVVVLNRLDGTITVVGAASGAVLDTVSIGASPLDADVLRGARAVHSASFSGNGSFACASCHPAGAQDQLLWDVADPDPNGIDPLGPRATQALRGLDGSADYHWDGIFPTLEELTRGTVEGPVMRGTISDNLAASAARYLHAIPHYPGAHRRPNDRLSTNAQRGLGRFVQYGCATSGCHNPPLWTSNGQLGNGIQSVSMRALNDRNQIAHNGVCSNLAVLECFGFYRGRIDAEAGLRAFLFTFFLQDAQQQDESIAFFDEGSTGFPGVLGAQVTLDGANFRDPVQRDLFFRIWNEIPAGKALLTVDGWWDGAVHFEYDPSTRFFCSPRGVLPFGRLADAIRSGAATLTFTARCWEEALLPPPALLEVRLDPAVSTFGTLVDVPAGSSVDLTLVGRELRPGVRLFVDRALWPDEPTRVDSQTLTLRFDVPAVAADTFLALQLQNPRSLFSNELPVRIRSQAP
jgi:YVTN family beta-propeller protein